MSYTDLLNANRSGVPGDIIDSIVPYLPVRDVLKLCLYNDTFNRRVCQNQDSIVWKVLYQRDISNNVPRDYIASHYLDIMDHILQLNPNQRLYYGAEHGYEEIVKSSPQHGANIHANDDYALRLAAMYGHTETVKLLLDHGANIHADNDDALHSAAENGHTETVKVLLDRGARIHALNDLALGLAAQNGHTDTVKVLLDYGADIHAGDDAALRYAAKYGHTETVKVLLDRGATITPYIRTIVEERGNPQIIALFNQK